MLAPEDVLNHYYLEARCQLLEIAAMLDRYDAGRQGGGGPPADRRLEQIYESLALLAQRDVTTERSERLLNLFSDPA
ncbi:MAG: hypothetical protein ACC628_09580 [Pirellulaceae bacterium]